MSDSFQIGDRHLLSLKAAVKLVPYTKEYIARLARDGKIAAAQINRQWYIDPQSLQNFFSNAQLEMQARMEYMSALRKQELDLHDWWERFTAEQSARAAGRTQRSLGKTIVVIILGLFVGFLVQSLSMYTDRSTLASLLSMPQLAAVPAAIDESAFLMWYEAGTVITETHALPLDAGIVLLPQATSSSSITHFFSDPVEVVMTSTTTGEIVTPDGQRMPFVRVPADASVMPAVVPTAPATGEAP